MWEQQLETQIYGGNLIIDLRNISGKFSLNLGSDSKIGAAGGNELDLATGKLHTATFTYYGIPNSPGSPTLTEGYLWTFVEDYA